MVLTDNFGILLAEQFRAPATGVNAFSMKNTSGTVNTFFMYDLQNNQNKFNNTITGARVQVGKGSTPATRQDFKVEDPFVVPSESLPTIPSIAGYNSGLGKVTISMTNAPTGDSGTVTEVILTNTFHKAIVPTVDNTIMMIRDQVSPVGFIAGKTINTEHTILI